MSVWRSFWRAVLPWFFKAATEVVVDKKDPKEALKDAAESASKDEAVIGAAVDVAEKTVEEVKEKFESD